MGRSVLFLFLVVLKTKEEVGVLDVGVERVGVGLDHRVVLSVGARARALHAGKVRTPARSDQALPPATEMAQGAPTLRQNLSTRALKASGDSWKGWCASPGMTSNVAFGSCSA